MFEAVNKSHAVMLPSQSENFYYSSDLNFLCCEKLSKAYEHICARYMARH